MLSSMYDHSLQQWSLSVNFKPSLLGITLVQGWIYVHNNNDKWHLRLLVSPLFNTLRHWPLFNELKQVAILM